MRIIIRVRSVNVLISVDTKKYPLDVINIYCSTCARASVTHATHIRNREVEIGKTNKTRAHRESLTSLSFDISSEPLYS